MLNHIVLMGRLTRDSELRHTQNGIPVCSFSIACEHDYKDANNNRAVDFVDIVAWRGTGEFVSKYFAKGRMAVIDGRLEIRDWTDRDGNKRRSAEIIANSVNFGDSKPQNQNQGQYQAPPASSYAAVGAQAGGAEPPEAEGDLPF